jgi:hypothetical protein
LHQEEAPAVSTWPQALAALEKLPLCKEGNAVGELQEANLSVLLNQTRPLLTPPLLAPNGVQYKYSKPSLIQLQLIRMSDKTARNMKITFLFLVEYTL